MAYYKRRKFYPRKKRFNKAVPFWRKKYSLMQLGYKAYRGVKYLKGLVNSEMYKFDTIATVNPVNAGETVTHLTPIAIGDGDSDRTGNSILVRSLDINGTVLYNGSSTASAQIVRMWVVIDRQQISDSAPTFSTIFENNGILSHLNNTTVGRFSLICVRKFIVNDDQQPGSYKTFHIRCPLMLHVRYNGSAGTDIQKNGIYLVCASSQDTSNGPSITFEARVSYRDN